MFFFLDVVPIPGGTQAFSSYPGSIFSGDDFYILSSGLVRVQYDIPDETYNAENFTH